MTDKAEKPFPYVKFRVIKTHRTHDNPNGEEEATNWYLNVSGTHNQVPCLQNYINQKHKIVGYGNLDSPKYGIVRSFVQSITGQNVDPRLLEDGPEKALAKKVADERKRQANQ